MAQPSRDIMQLVGKEASGAKIQAYSEVAYAPEQIIQNIDEQLSRIMGENNDEDEIQMEDDD